MFIGNVFLVFFAKLKKIRIISENNTRKPQSEMKRFYVICVLWLLILCGGMQVYSQSTQNKNTDVAKKMPKTLTSVSKNNRAVIAKSSIQKSALSKTKTSKNGISAEEGRKRRAQRLQAILEKNKKRKKQK